MQSLGDILKNHKGASKEDDLLILAEPGKEAKPGVVRTNVTGDKVVDLTDTTLPEKPYSSAGVTGLISPEYSTFDLTQDFRASPEQLEKSLKSGGQVLKGVISPESISKKNKEALGLATTRELKQTLNTLSETSLTMARWTERGVLGAGNKKTIELIYKKHPELRKAVAEKGVGEFDRHIFGITPEEQAQEARWAASDPFEGGVGHYALSAIKQFATQGDIFASIPNPVALHDLMYEETAQRAKAEFDRRGIDVDLSKYEKEFELAALFQGVVEGASAAIDLASLGKKKILLGITPFSEAGEEYWQANIGAHYVNQILAKEAKEQRIEFVPLDPAVVKAEAIQGAKMGFAVGSIFTGVGSVKHIAQQVVMPDAQVAKLKKEATADLKENQVQSLVFSYAQKQVEYSEQALNEADLTLQDALSKLETGELLNIARAFDITARAQSKEDLIALIMEHKFDLPEYNTALDQSFVGILNSQEDLSVQDQHLHKWMSTGEVKPHQIPMVKMALEHMIPGNVDTFFNEFMELQDSGTLVDFNQINEWFHWGQNDFDIEKADKIIADTEKCISTVRTAQLKAIQLPLVITESSKVADADYTTYPIIIGIDKWGHHKLLDGHHRAKKAIEDGVETVPAYILTQEETKQIASHESNLIFGQTVQTSEAIGPALERHLIRKGMTTKKYVAREAMKLLSRLENGEYATVMAELPGMSPELQEMVGNYRPQAKQLEFFSRGIIPVDHIQIGARVQLMVAMGQLPETVTKQEIINRAVQNQSIYLTGPDSATGENREYFVSRFNILKNLTPDDFELINDDLLGFFQAEENVTFVNNFEQGELKLKNYRHNVTHSDFSVFENEGQTLKEALIGHLKEWIDSEVLSAEDRSKVREELATLQAQDPPFHQKGRTLPTGAQVMRGKLSVLQNGKFMLDLLKGGDLGTLMHEFAHLFSTFMGEEIRDILIASVVENFHPNLKGNKGLQAAEANIYKKIWDDYSLDPAGTAQAITDPNRKRLTRMQEHLAVSFEAYLAQGRAPTRKLTSLFKEAAKVIGNYYKKVRNLPMEFQDVNVKLAEAFDKYLAGEKAIPRDIKTVDVKLADTDGTIHTYRVNKSRVQIEKHKKIIKAMRRGLADVNGLKDLLTDYTEVIFGKNDIPKPIDLIHKRAIAAIENEKQGRKYLDTVDAELAKIQEDERASEIKKIQKLVKKMKKSDILKEIQHLIDKVLENIDVVNRSEKNVQKNLELARSIAKLKNLYVLEMEDVPVELRSITKAQLDELANFKKRQMEYFTIEELQQLNDTLSDLYRYNKFRIKQAREEAARELITRKKALIYENSANWRYTRGINRDAKLRIGTQKFLKRMGKAYSEELKSQLINMYMLGEGNPNSEWVKLANALVDGREEQLNFAKEMYDILRNIVKSMPTHGVSYTLGTVNESDLIPIQMFRAEVGWKTVNVTIGQLMMWYGWSQNPDGLDGLLSGIKLPEYKEELFTFETHEGLVTALTKLPDSYKKIVDFVMLLYKRRIYPAVDEIFRDLNLGISLKEEVSYLPLSREAKDKSNIGKETGFLAAVGFGDSVKDFYIQHILSLDFLHERRAKGSPVYAVDFFANIGRNINKVSFYIGMAKPVTDVRALIFGEKDQAGSVHKQLVKMMTRLGATEMENFIDNIQDPRPKRDSGFIAGLIKANSKVRTARLNLSASVLSIQPVTARLAKAYGISEISMAKATAKVMVTVFDGRRIQKLLDFSSLMWERYERIPAVHMEREGVDHQARRAWIAPSSFMKKLVGIRNKQDLLDMLKRSDDSTLSLLAFFDSIALSIIQEGINFEAQKKNWDAEAVRRKFLEAIPQSQPMNDPLFTSNFLANKNALYRAIFGVYQSARDGIRRTQQRCVMQIDNRLHGQKGETSLGKSIVNLIDAIVITGLITSFLQTVFKRIGRKDGDDWGDDEWDDSFFNDWMMKNLTNYISLAPLAGDTIAALINYAARGWPITTGEMPLIGGVAEISKDLVELGKDISETGEGADWDSETDVPMRVWNVLMDASVFYGNSWANIDRQARKWYDAWKEDEWE